ncbi:MAG: hypothetical protein HeimC3_22880 [Candidatus Heimdallarchaeota archaeon LC_3]|nr:MAG: hypothetical protein HeimC3_22880 [Candidatus Heimdallarchaeota archaeon LC_3]
MVKMSLDKDDLREIIAQVFNEALKAYIKPIDKKLDELDKKMNQLHSKIEGVQFLTKEEIITLRKDIKAIMR